MKKMLCFTVLVVLSFTSCMKLPEEKANILIEEYIKSCLFKPETYEIDRNKSTNKKCRKRAPKVHSRFLALSHCQHR